MVIFSFPPMEYIPPGLSLLCTLLLASILFTFIVMPFVTRIFRLWLYPEAP